MSLGNNYIRYS